MNAVAGVIGGVVVGAAIGVGAMTLYKGGAGSVGLPVNQGVATSGGALMELDGTTYGEADLPSNIRTMIFEAQSEAHERVNGILNQFALQLSLAKEKGQYQPGKPLPLFEDLLDVPPPSEEELKALFEANKSRLPPNTSFDAIKDDIEKFVTNQKLSEALREKNETFKKSNRLTLLTAAPQPPKVDLELNAFVTKSTPTATRTLVEVADYLCPHCQMVQVEVESLLKEHGDKVRLVAVPYSLKPEGLSGSLARGAWCAQQQGDDAFWKYHETAFRQARAKGWKTTDPAANEPVTEVAKEAGIDVEKVEACIATDEAQAFVKNTIESMQDAGITGTPTFFLDGRRVHSHGVGVKDAIVALLQASS